MLEKLYENIGGRIKNWAKWTFIVEAITAIIAGISIMVADIELIVTALLVIFFGPIIAWIASWLLYAFGELVEKTCDNENNTKQILKILKGEPDSLLSRMPAKNVRDSIGENKQPSHNPTPIKKPAAVHSWLCSSCGKMRNNTPCEHCGKD